MKVTATVELELPDDFEPSAEAAWDAQVWEGICTHAMFPHQLISTKFNSYASSYTKDYHEVWLRALQKSQWKFKYD